jgi:hypothetical protein
MNQLTHKGVQVMFKTKIKATGVTGMTCDNICLVLTLKIHIINVSVLRTSAPGFCDNSLNFLL